MKLQSTILGLILVISVVSAATSSKSDTNTKPLQQVETTDILSTLDSDIFDENRPSQDKYKRAIGELDSLLGSLMAEINEKQKAEVKSRTKRQIYGGGGGGGGGGEGGGGGGHHGWGHHESQYGQQYESHGHQQSQHHGWHPAPQYRVHHHHHGIPPEFLLKTALILKGILILGHVAAMG